MNGYFVEYRSMMDGSPCVALFTLKSENTGTGDMVQVWFMPRGEKPSDAARSGRDAAVCGDCRLRPAASGICYVILWRGPDDAWLAYDRENYRRLDTGNPEHIARLREKPIRFGAWGEPVSIPAWWYDRVFLRDVRPIGWTGYTHQWRKPWAREYQHLFMASVDSPAERKEAKELGWRTFRVHGPGDSLLPGEFICPKSRSVSRLDCRRCLACDGGPTRKGDPAILVHGHGAGRWR